MDMATGGSSTKPSRLAGCTEVLKTASPRRGWWALEDCGVKLPHNRQETAKQAGQALVLNGQGLGPSGATLVALFIRAVLAALLDLCTRSGTTSGDQE